MNGVLSHLTIPRKEILAEVGRGGGNVSKVYDVKYYFQSEQSIQNHSILNRGLQSSMGSFFAFFFSGSQKSFTAGKHCFSDNFLRPNGLVDITDVASKFLLNDED